MSALLCPAGDLLLLRIEFTAKSQTFIYFDCFAVFLIFFYFMLILRDVKATDGDDKLILIRVLTPSYTSNSRTFEGLSRPNCLKFKEPTQHSLRYCSRLITLTALRICIMRTSGLYWSSQTTIKKRWGNTSQLWKCLWWSMSPGISTFHT